jgi:hypothetical protein
MGYRNYSTGLGHIVDATGHGDFTTISSAITAAVSGETIFIRPGTYTENPTLKAGVNLSAFPSDGAASGQGATVVPNVIILGTTTINISGSVSLAGIQFQTNGANAISNSGSNAANVIFTDCSIYANNATGMNLTGSATDWTFNTCTFNSSSTNSLFTVYGNIDFENCIFGLSSSASASTVSTGNISLNGCDSNGLFLTTSSTGTVTSTGSYLACGGNTFLTTAGTGTSAIYSSLISSTTASALSAGSGTTIQCFNSTISSSNTNAVTGAGTFQYGGVVFSSTSATINTTTQTPIPWSIPQGGTAVSSFNINGPVISNTTTAGALRSVTLANQQLLVGNTSAAPTAKAFSVNIQTFTSSGTYTPSTGLLYCIIECVGSGGGGAGCTSTTSDNYAGGAGGGGAYSRKFASSSTIGSSQTVTIGAAGSGGAAGNNNGTNGNAVSVGVICTANGGSGGGYGAAGGQSPTAGAGGTAGTGDFSVPGQPGSINDGLGFGGEAVTSVGGASGLGFGYCVAQTGTFTSTPGSAGGNYGAGGGGGAAFGANTAAGGNGAKGIVIITEYIIN